MNYLFRIFAVLSCLVVSACSHQGDTVSDVAAAEEVEFVLPTAADYEVPPLADYNIDFTLSNDAIDNKLIMLESLPTVIFTVWGFDEMAADVSATKIVVNEFPLRPQSVPYALRFSTSDFQAVEFQSGMPEAMKYYITFGVDVDKDGEFCNGDFRQDYNLSQPERFPVALSSVNREIAVTEVSGEICTAK